MRAVVQRVTRARVLVAGHVVGEIAHGLAVLLGVARGDTQEGAEYLAEKIANLRIFEDADGKMNLSVLETQGAVLVVSQFTLLGDTRKGRRPGFDQAAPPSEAEPLYQKFVDALRLRGLRVETGVFQAHMELKVVNNGPVTLLLDSGKLF